MQTFTVTAPAHWASYFVNGDASGLNDEELVWANAWLKREGVEILDVMRDADGEGMEPRFSWSVQLYAPEVDYKGGDLLDYLAVSI